MLTSEYENNNHHNSFRELDEYSAMTQVMNQYEKTRNRNFTPLSVASIEDKARMETMINKTRRQEKEYVKDYARNFQKKLNKGEPIELPTFNQQEVPVSDLSYVLAETLQHLYSSEDPKAEYYDWVQAQQNIEVAITTNGTTEDEINARNLFIGFLDDRETELKLIIHLYENAERGSSGYFKEMAQNKLSFMHFKLSELRRLRDRTQATKNKSDEQERQEKEMTKTVAQTIGGIAIASLAVQELQQNGQYLANKYLNNEFENDIDGIITHYRPVTRSRDDIMEKKERTVRNMMKMREIIAGLRNGQSVTEMEQMQQKHSIRERIMKIRGFDHRRYHALENERG